MPPADGAALRASAGPDVSIPPQRFWSMLLGCHLERPLPSVLQQTVPFAYSSP